LPLIDKTIVQLAKAKIYIKLNIWQVFYRIRIDPNSEELTTFCEKVEAVKCEG